MTKELSYQSDNLKSEQFERKCKFYLFLRFISKRERIIYLKNDTNYRDIIPSGIHWIMMIARIVKSFPRVRNGVQSRSNDHRPSLDSSKERIYLMKNYTSSRYSA